MSLTASTTNHARWFSGSHSRSDSDINSNCSRSHSMKYWGMPRSLLTGADGPGVYETASHGSSGDLMPTLGIAKAAKRDESTVGQGARQTGAQLQDQANGG